MIQVTSCYRRNSVLLSELNVLGTRAFRTAALGECYSLSFTEIVELNSFKTRRVKEQIFLSASVDEAKTFVGDAFDRTLCHLLLPLSVVCGFA